MPLKELEVRYTERRSRPFKLFDGAGLFVLVKPNGTKLWRLKYRMNGRENTLCLGQYPSVSLAAARMKRNEAKVKISQGIDPAPTVASSPTPVDAMTFDEVARLWHANREAGLCPAHAQRVWRRMERDVLPIIGGQLIGEITAPIILATVRQVEARGALDISRRLKQGIGQVFRFAIANGWTKDDPSVHLAGALKPKPRVRHMPRVALRDMPALFRAIGDYDGENGPYRREVTRDALTFTLLTWARTSETRFATWGEFEGLAGDEPLWRIPAERMKMHREHIVPLSCQAAELLRRRRFASDEAFVFPGEKAGQPISANTMIFACYRMGYRSKQTCTASAGWLRPGPTKRNAIRRTGSKRRSRTPMRMRFAVRTTARNIWAGGGRCCRTGRTLWIAPSKPAMPSARFYPSSEIAEMSVPLVSFALIRVTKAVTVGTLRKFISNTMLVALASERSGSGQPEATSCSTAKTAVNVGHAASHAIRICRRLARHLVLIRSITPQVPVARQANKQRRNFRPRQLARTR